MTGCKSQQIVLAIDDILVYGNNKGGPLLLDYLLVVCVCGSQTPVCPFVSNKWHWIQMTGILSFT